MSDLPNPDDLLNEPDSVEPAPPMPTFSNKERYGSPTDAVEWMHTTHLYGTEQFLKTVGPVEFATAAMASDNEKIRWIAEVMCNPKTMELPFAFLCKRAGVSMRQLVDFWTEVKVMSGKLHMMNSVDTIMVDTTANAKNKKVKCRKCHGEGQVVVKGEVEECPKCDGTGSLEKEGTRHAVDKVFETAGLNAKAPMINIDARQYGSGTLEETVSDIGKILNEGRK